MEIDLQWDPSHDRIRDGLIVDGVVPFFHDSLAANRAKRTTVLKAPSCDTAVFLSGMGTRAIQIAHVRYWHLADTGLCAAHLCF
jgi:hypothetical protein